MKKKVRTFWVESNPDFSACSIGEKCISGHRTEHHDIELVMKIDYDIMAKKVEQMEKFAKIPAEIVQRALEAINYE